jgi:hypothetical protein
MKLSLNVLPLPIWAKVLKNSLFAFFVVLPMVTVSSAPAFAQTATATTLAVTSAGSPATTVASPAVVTLTANVTTGGAPVTHGTVNFCYSSQTACSGAGMIGAAQLTTSGTAAISIHPAIGAHSYTQFSWAALAPKPVPQPRAALPSPQVLPRWSQPSPTWPQSAIPAT